MSSPRFFHGCLYGRQADVEEITGSFFQFFSQDIIIRGSVTVVFSILFGKQNVLADG